MKKKKEMRVKGWVALGDSSSMGIAYANMSPCIYFQKSKPAVTDRWGETLKVVKCELIFKP